MYVFLPQIKHTGNHRISCQQSHVAATLIVPPLLLCCLCAKSLAKMFAFRQDVVEISYDCVVAAGRSVSDVSLS